MSKQFSSDISTNTFIRFWLVMVGFFAIIVMVYLMRNALLLIGISIFIALALNPPVSAISRHLPGKSRVGATAIAYLIVVASLFIFSITVVPTVVDQLARFLKTVPSIVDNVTEQSVWINDAVDRYGLQKQYDQTIESIQRQTTQAASDLGVSFFNSVGSILTVFATTLLVLVFAFLMLIEGPEWMNRIWALYKDPEKRTHHRQLVHKMYRIVTGYVSGQVLISGISATCSLVVIIILSTIFDMPPSLAIPIAAILFVAGLVPLFGATVGATIAAILLGINNVSAAVFFIIYYIIYQQIENNFISPTVQSRAVEISALTVLVSLTIGLSLFGILGGIISIPIGGCIRVLVLDYIEKRQRKQAKA